MDLYAAQLLYDVAYRSEWCEGAGLGFELGELGYKSGVMTDVYDKTPEDSAWRAEMAERLGTGFIVPSCTEFTEKTKTATELLAV